LDLRSRRPLCSSTNLAFHLNAIGDAIQGFGNNFGL
jgi:hypothetical protein